MGLNILYDFFSETARQMHSQKFVDTPRNFKTLNFSANIKFYGLNLKEVHASCAIMPWIQFQKGCIWAKIIVLYYNTPVCAPAKILSSA